MSDSVHEGVLLVTTTTLWLLLLLRVPFLSRPATRALRWASSKPQAVLAANIFLALAICVAISAALGFPEPKIHDEFSYLLAGETVFEGRLANPPHRRWQHFETMHVLQQPTHASKYPIGQGAAIAVGFWLGNPIFGVWLSLAFACGAICWMLQGWLKPQWALLASLIATIQLCTADYPGGELQQSAYWGQSYWGGAVAAAGGALLLGGIRRHARVVNWGSSLAGGLGVAILAHSRPFEGLIVAVPSLAVYSWLWVLRRDSERRFGPPLALGSVLLASFTLTAVHNVAATGSALQFPYSRYEDTYSLTGLTLLHPPKEASDPDAPVYRHQAMRQFYTGWAYSEFAKQLSLQGYLDEKWKRLMHLWEFFIGPVLSLPCVIFAVSRQPRWLQFSVLTVVSVLAVHALTPWMHPHYMAPVAGVVYLWVGKGLASLKRWRIGGRPIGASVAMPVGLAILLLVIADAIDSVLDNRHRNDSGRWHIRRAGVEKRLTESPSQHLIIVRYGSPHSPHHEWVYNRPDLERAQVVWARDMGERNRELVEDFPTRRVWLLEVSGSSTELRDFPDWVEFPGPAR